jgi:hypothetical protein
MFVKNYAKQLFLSRLQIKCNPSKKIEKVSLKYNVINPAILKAVKSLGVPAKKRSGFLLQSVIAAFLAITVFPL